MRHEHRLNSKHISFYKTDFVSADITAIMRHFDRVVVQQSYEPYGGFNFNYLFITSICLLIVSHVFNAIYWWGRMEAGCKVMKRLSNKVV